MKRDMNVIRSIAFAVEALPPGKELEELSGVDAQTFGAHVKWMIDAGLVDGGVTQYIGERPPEATVRRLTWNGCDFLDAARSDTLWKRAQESVIGPTMSWTFDILKEWLKAEIKNGLPTLRGLAN